MDVVYIVKVGRYNEELRYSLRSISKNLPHRRVFIIGYKPKWVRRVIHIPMEQIQARPFQNTGLAIEKACYNTDISDNFILFNDDFFVMKPIKKVEPIHRGTIKSVLDYYEGKESRYLDNLKRTKELLESFDIENPLCYEAHIPIVINKQKYLALQEILPKGKEIYDFSKRSLYGNYYKIGGTRIPRDVKVPAGTRIPNKTYISTTEKSFNKCRVGAYIRRQFMTRGRYEQH